MEEMFVVEIEIKNVFGELGSWSTLWTCKYILNQHIA